MIRWRVSNESERIREEALWMNFSYYYPDICVQGLSKTAENLSQDSSSLFGELLLLLLRPTVSLGVGPSFRVHD
jgi:hypothetical protein